MPTENQQDPKTDSNPNVTTILEWSAPGRPYKKKTKQFYLTAILIALFLEVILFLFSQYLLMMVVASLVFVAFALVTVPPRDFKYRISSQGIMIEDIFYLWKELYDFYFLKRNGIETLHISTENYLPGELVLTLGEIKQDEVKNTLLQYLPFREYVKPTFMDKSANWLTKNFPLDNK